jgi:hypothetical protein
VLLSYASQDAEAAERNCAALGRRSAVRSDREYQKFCV